MVLLHPLSPLGDGRRGGAPSGHSPNQQLTKVPSGGGSSASVWGGGPACLPWEPLGMLQVVLQPGMEVPSSE